MWLIRLNLTLMLVGLALMVQPFWSGGLRAGFFLTLLTIVSQNILTRLPNRPVRANQHVS
jgi:hypothetical protein